MSEAAVSAPAVAESAPVTSEAPMSSSDVAAQVVESYEQSDSSDPGQQAAESYAEPAKEPAKETTPALSDEEKAIEALLSEFGFKEMKKPDGREFYIPRSKVLKMIGSGLKRGQEKWTTERGVFESQVNELRGHIDTLRASVAGDPRAFLSELAGIDPRYQAFLQQQAQAQSQPAEEQMPAPDLTLQDGSKTYSLEGLQKLLDWNTKRVEGKLDERLKPLQQREQEARQRAEQERVMGQIRERAQSQMAEAQTWPLFGKFSEDGKLTEFQEAVLNELKADTTKKMTLEGAYIKVASKRMTEDDATKRERLLKEINGAPKSTATVGVVERTAKPGPRSTADIVRDVVSKSEGA